jgi:hypothetical protein
MVAAFVVAACAAALGCANTSSQSAKSSTASAAGAVAWDEQSSRELVAALHHMHEVWNTGNIQSLKSLLAGDEVLVTFELDPATDAPIQLRSKADIDKFVEKIVEVIHAKQADSQLEMPMLNCRATRTFGVCTEECKTHMKMPDGTDRIDRLWSTAVAVKTAEGWKWLQWHQSVAAPPQIVAPKQVSQR